MRMGKLKLTFEHQGDFCGCNGRVTFRYGAIDKPGFTLACDNCGFSVFVPWPDIEVGRKKLAPHGALSAVGGGELSVAGGGELSEVK